MPACISPVAEPSTAICISFEKRGPDAWQDLPPKGIKIGEDLWRDYNDSCNPIILQHESFFLF